MILLNDRSLITHFSFFISRKIKAYIHQWKLGNVTKNPDKARWEEDYELIDNEGLFDEYLEMGEYTQYEYLEISEYS